MSQKLRFFLYATTFLSTLYLLCGPPVNAQESDETTSIYSIHVNRGVDNAAISWKTDPPTKGRIEYTDASGDWQSTPWQEDFVTDHSLTIVSLQGDTTYVFRVNAENANGLLETKTDTFTTLSTQILGAQQPSVTNTYQNGGFQSVLTQPAQNTNPYNYTQPQVLGQQTIPGMPYFQNIIPLAIAPPATTPQPTATPIPVTAIGSLNNLTNGPTLLLGVITGCVVTFTLHYISRKNKTPIIRTRRRHTEPMTVKRKKEIPNRNTHRKMQFRLNTAESKDSSLRHRIIKVG